MRGAKPGERRGGRQKGSRNKATGKIRADQAAIAASGITPLDYMLSVLRDPDAAKERRAWAAVSAAPYVHPRLTSIGGTPHQPLNVIHRVERVIVHTDVTDGGSVRTAPGAEPV